MKKIIHAALKFPNGETPATIRARAGLDGKSHVKEAFARLLNDGVMEECGVIKGGRKTPRDGYRLTTVEN